MASKSCFNCGNLLLSGCETCIVCGRPNPGFKPREFSYTPLVNITPKPGRPVGYRRPVNPGVRIVTEPFGRGTPQF